jgi:AcrR family transcriptional regulator
MHAMSSPPARRTQEQRRAETRAKLLDATVSSVLEVGYAHTTTRRVAELAGVSAGAEAYHFPRRVDLVGAAVEHLAQRRIAEGRRRVTELPTAPHERLPAVLDLLWGDFSSPIFVVFVKLWVAAADEPELYARLVTAERQIVREITKLAYEILGDLAARPRIERMLLLVLSACRGLALTEHFEPHDHRRRAQWPALRAALLHAVSAEVAGSDV